MQRVLFFLTFRSNREIFFCSFFRLSGWWGNERNYFCFFERKTPSLFNCFSNFITWCSESYLGLVWHFAKRFFLKIWIFSLSSMNFFFAVGSFSVCVFLFSLFVLFLFFESKRWWWGGVFGICSTKWRGWLDNKIKIIYLIISFLLFLALTIFLFWKIRKII